MLAGDMSYLGKKATTQVKGVAAEVKGVGKALAAESIEGLTALAADSSVAAAPSGERR